MVPFHFQSFDFDAWDQAPPSNQPLHFLLTCCSYTVPEEAAGDAGIGDELPCPHCGDVAAVYAIQGHQVIAPEYEEEETVPHWEMPFYYRF